MTDTIVVRNLINIIDNMSYLDEIERRVSFSNVDEDFLSRQLSGAIDDFIDDIYDCEGIIAFTEKNDRIILNINDDYFVISRNASNKGTNFYISRYGDLAEAFERYCYY